MTELSGKDEWQRSSALQRLAAAETKDRLVDALWDLRDSAFDAPAAWSTFSALELFQALAEGLDEAPVDAGGQVSTGTMVRALAAALDVRPVG